MSYTPDQLFFAYILLGCAAVMFGITVIALLRD
jgi:hypothetical protein